MPPLVRSRRPFAVSALDFKVGLRILARFPGLTVVATLAIAVAIALGTIYFEAVNKWQNPRLPIPDADRAVSIVAWDASASAPNPRTLFDYATWASQARSLDLMGAAIPFQRNLRTVDGNVEPVYGAEISATAFTLMGTPAFLGRGLTTRDEDPAEAPAVVVGYRLWQSRFGGDASVVGTSVVLGSTSVTIVGVMPEGFSFPETQQLWTPLRTDGATLTPGSGPVVKVFGRLAPQSSLADAQAELAVIGTRLASSFPDTHRHIRPMVMGYARPIGAGQMLLIRNVMYAVNLVFLLLLAVVCTNVATLVFARTATRGWEITVRTALGASRRRIVGQLFVEALVLAALAAGVGLVLAKVALRLGIAQFAASNVLPFWIDDSLSLRTMAYAILLTVVGASIVGVLPALRVTRINVQDAMRNEGAARSGLKFGSFWTAVIVVQVAITVAFLPLAAGGAYQSNRFGQRAQGIGAERFVIANVGMDRENYVLDSASSGSRARQAVSALEQRLRAEPGVEGVTFADRLPVEDQFKYTIALDSTMVPATSGIRRSTLVKVGSGYFDTFQTRLVAGRAFGLLDYEGGQAMIVNESFARHVLGNRNAIGQRVRIVNGEIDAYAGDQWYEIVGVIADFGWQLPEPQEQSAMYLPSLPVVGTASQLAVRARDAEDLATRLRKIAAEADPTIQLSDVKPLGLAGGGEAQMNWVLTSVAWLVGFIVLLLSATGIHALMSFTVARRTREIGIRAALGAGAGAIVFGIFARAFLQLGLGVAVGSGIASLGGLGSTRQVLVLLGADAIMLVVGLGACALPLRRALRVDPTEALRAEA